MAQQKDPLKQFPKEYPPPVPAYRLRCPFLHHGPVTQCRFVAVGASPLAAAAGVNDHLNAADAGAIGQ